MSFLVKYKKGIRLIRNYFADLELDVGASLDEVRKAYKRLARKFHPDLNPLDAQAAESFRRIQEAAQKLNSETRIVRLSKHLSTGSAKPVAKRSNDHWGSYPVIPNSAERFASDWIDESSRSDGSRRSKEELDFWIRLEVAQRDLNQGAVKRLRVQYLKPCQGCRGSGATARSVQSTCKRCAGTGHFLIERGAMHWKKACDDCSGKGYSVDVPCSQCKGVGKTTNEDLVEIRIPKRADPTRAVALKGSGHISFNGKRRGDVWVQIITKRERRGSKLRRKYHDCLKWIQKSLKNLPTKDFFNLLTKLDG